MLNETYIAPLLEYFSAIVPLNKEEKALLIESFSSRLYRRKQYVLQENDVCQQMNFVVSGCLRMYKINEKGTEHIIQFASENYWLTDIDSLYSETPAEFSIDAIEDTIVLQINRTKLYDLYTKAPKFNRIFRVLIERAYVMLQRRLLQNISASAQQNYLYFTKTYPHLLNRLPQTQIAAFLGITPVSLSNIKSSLLKTR